MSPKADLEAAVENGGADYVLSFKPNPAYMAPDTFRAEQVRTDIEQSLAKTKGCCVEIILKDITTVRGEAARLDNWAETVMAIVENK